MKGQSPLFERIGPASGVPVLPDSPHGISDLGRNHDGLEFPQGKKTPRTSGLIFKNHIVPHTIPSISIPNSTIIQRDDTGNIVRIRYYDGDGKAYKDVDYTDHNRPETHKVPHTHDIVVDKDGKIISRK